MEVLNIQHLEMFLYILMKYAKSLVALENEVPFTTEHIRNEIIVYMCPYSCFSCFDILICHVLHVAWQSSLPFH